MNTSTPKILRTVGFCVYEGGNTKNETKCADPEQLPNGRKGL